MGSLCSSQDENQVDRTPVEAPLVVWGDVVNSESRVVMTLLALARQRYQFQQVTTPIDGVDQGDSYANSSLQLWKEDLLEVPEDQNKLRRGKRITARSIFICERDSFFTHISAVYTDQKSQLIPSEQGKRMNQCLEWHHAVLQPAVKRLVEAKRRLQLFQQRKKNAAQTNSMLFSLSSEQVSDQEKAYNLCLMELKQYLLPAIENQLLIRKFFCSAQRGQKGAFSLADIIIYHELYTALAITSLSVEPTSFPNTTTWLTTMTSEAPIQQANNRLQDHLSQQRYSSYVRQSSGTTTATNVGETTSTSISTAAVSPQLRSSTMRSDSSKSKSRLKLTTDSDDSD